VASVLEGIKVLDFTQVYSGPFCTLLLKDFGAEIIKIERPGAGDLIRSDVPHTPGMEGGAFITLNRGKKSVTVNLKTAKGRHICQELAKKVDVLVENFSPEKSIIRRHSSAGTITRCSRKCSAIRRNK
jgi:crotonobetainyl-CoA:carnitine CoA-transferase CaiB-like acyl-CoA transferase